MKERKERNLEIAESSEFAVLVLHRKSDKWERGTGNGERGTGNGKKSQ
ncbi:MAG: hypothetical protein ACPGWR_20215 [Ardenticatenaceae bacterium]